MADARTLIRARFRVYMLKVVAWLVASGLGSMFGMAFASRALGDAPTVMAILGFGSMLGVVGGALLIHRSNVRCPGCERWLPPMGVNGFIPKKCPHCAADFS